MRIIFILAFVLVFLNTTPAQVISGKISNNEQYPIPKVSVSLLRASDSSMVKTTLTDTDGIYKFEKIVPGSYLLMVSCVGYEQNYSAVFEHDTTKTMLRNLLLSKTEVQLKAVTITATRPPFEVKAGKTIVNVDASPTNAGLNVLEILEKSPGITVTNDGNVNLKGKSGVLMLIDGKQTYMSGAQLATFLKTIQSNSIDQIEIMTVPPAKYDAAGNAGVINIKTKKNLVKGMNGSITLVYSQGYYPRYNGLANFNYRNDKLNIFGNYSGTHWRSQGTSYISRRLTEAESGLFQGTYQQESMNRNSGSANNLKLGMDYNFTKKDVAGIIITWNPGKWEEIKDGPSKIFNASGAPIYTLLSHSINGGHYKDFTANFNYKHSFDSLGREITVDLDQASYRNNDMSDLSTQIQNPAGTPIGNIVHTQGSMPANINIYSAKADYALPFTKNLKLESGAKVSFVSTNNSVIYQRDSTTGWYVDETNSNHFIYKENINAAYATLSATVKKWEFTGGLRLENTISKGTQLTLDSTFSKSYTNLFPTLGVTYNISNTHQLAWAYNKRITRPDYSSLNPFVYFIDSLTSYRGNPYLQPQFTNNIELSYAFKRLLTATVNYTTTRNIITSLFKQDGQKNVQTLENLSNLKQVGIAISVNYPITKWWNFTLYGNLFNNNYQGVYVDGNKSYPIKQKVTAFAGKATSSMTFSSIYAFELSSWYNSKTTEGLLIGNSMGILNAAMSCQMFSKKAVLKIGVTDIFATLVFNGYARYATVDTQIKNLRDSRRFNISFTYKFGTNNSASNRKHTSGATEEQNRVKSGG